jgi:microsomal dipeptidase-like Zn-dependent dipeptidase
VAVAGVTHVAIGSDLDGNIRPIRAVHTTADLAGLAAALHRAGLDDAAVRAILAGNARRFLARLPGHWRCPPPAR